MGKAKKIILGVVGTIIALLIFIVILSYFLLKRTLPEYDGSVTAKGLNSQVTVVRDSFAIPMIEAQNDEDAAYALGYVHAQERLFQMDVARRAGEGRLSEVFGRRTLVFDKMFKTVGIFEAVKRDFNKLNPQSQKILIAYSKGVNEYIKEAKGHYPIEFDVLGYDPYQWKPEHSLMIAKLMGWELNISWWTDIAFASLVQKLGEQKARELLPNYPENAPTIIPKNIFSSAKIPTDFINADRDFRTFTGFVGTHIGSNNWVVNGKKSVSGKPIIANDPHLAFTAPGKWYFAIIRSPELNVEGFTIPGLPAVVIGKNENIAWAMTNVMADDADFYIEKLDSSKNNYLLNGQWRPVTVKEDSIAVKDSSYYHFEIRTTDHGPIISDVHRFHQEFPKAPGSSAIISMRWTGLEFSDEIFAAISLNKAKDWNDFKNALSYFTVPGQNFVYGDNKGNIGYVCAAKLPIRNNTSPTLIYDGTTDKYDWKGFVPYDEMPKLFNPPQNFIASANDKTVSSFPYHISNLWEPPSRIERIIELLKSKQKNSVGDFKKYQNDFVSPYARELIPYILSAFENVKVNDPNLQTALDLFKNWDFNLNAESQVPTVYTRFIHFFLKDTFEDELGDNLLREYVMIENIPYRIITEYLANGSSFFDNVNTDKIETRDDIIRQSLVDAINDLEKEYGNKMENWQWGKVHQVTFRHMFSGASGILDKLINIGPYEIGGDGTTIFNTEYSFDRLFQKDSKGMVFRTHPYENILGPSMRYIFDFGSPDYINIILPTGESGNFISDHYSDMTEKWLEGKYIKLPLRDDVFRSKAKHILTLNPK